MKHGLIYLFTIFFFSEGIKLMMFLRGLYCQVYNFIFLGFVCLFVLFFVCVFFFFVCVFLFVCFLIHASSEMMQDE